MLNYYLGWNVPWIIFSVLLTAGAVAMMVRGVAVSTKLAGFFFGFEMLVLVIVAVAALIKNGGTLSAAPFDPHNITHGFSGLAAGFPLADLPVHRLGELRRAGRGDRQPAAQRAQGRVHVRRADGGHLPAARLRHRQRLPRQRDRARPAAPIPFIDVAHGVAPALAFFAYLAGMTSTLGVLISAVNSQCRLIFNAGREGLLPRWIGKVHPARRTPINAIFTFVGIASRSSCWLGARPLASAAAAAALNALNFFDESATMGTILILVVYFLANLALPFYYRKYRPAEFNVIKHADPAGSRHGGDRRPDLLPVQAAAAARPTTGSRTWPSASSSSPSSTPSC